MRVMNINNVNCPLECTPITWDDYEKEKIGALCEIKKIYEIMNSGFRTIF